MAFDWQSELSAVPASPKPSHVTNKVSPSSVDTRVCSFAQVLSPTSIAVTEPLPQPALKGDSLSIKITEEVHAKGIAACLTNFHGRLVLNKNDKPYTAKEISDKLSKQWETAAPWKLISLGKGFFEFSFASAADMRLVWAMGTVNFKPGLLCLSQWTKDFNKHTQRQKNAQVWVWLMELPQEY